MVITNVPVPIIDSIVPCEKGSGEKSMSRSHTATSLTPSSHTARTSGPSRIVAPWPAKVMPSCPSRSQLNPLDTWVPDVAR